MQINTRTGRAGWQRAWEEDGPGSLWQKETAGEAASGQEGLRREALESVRLF